MSVDKSLSDAVVTFIGMDRDALPGRHPERIDSGAMRAQVEEIIGELDAIRPDESAADLFEWAEREVDGIAAAHPGLSGEARDALVSLLSFTWR